MTSRYFSSAFGESEQPHRVSLMQNGYIKLLPKLNLRAFEFVFEYYVNTKITTTN